MTAAVPDPRPTVCLCDGRPGPHGYGDSGCLDAVPDPRFRDQLAEACTRRVSSAADDEDTYECGRPATVEALTTAGQWEPHCATHVQGWPSDRVRDHYPVNTYAVIRVDDSMGSAWPVVERVPGGWQSGEHHYPDAAVSSVRVLYLVSEALVEARVQAAANQRAAEAVRSAFREVAREYYRAPRADVHDWLWEEGDTRAAALASPAPAPHAEAGS